MNIKDGDIVVITVQGYLEIGLFYDNRILTLKHNRLNIRSVRDVLVVGSTPEIQEVVNKIKEKYKNELVKQGSEPRVLTVNELQPGMIVETKSGKQWLVMGKNWSLECKDNSNRYSKSGRLFINMVYIDKALSLRENINNLILSCRNIDDMEKYFKFSVPKAIKSMQGYTKEDIKDYMLNGLTGVMNSKQQYGFILNAENMQRILEMYMGIQ